MEKKSFYIGLTLIIISFIVCVVSFYLLFFGFPIFVIGSALVLCSRSSTKMKLLVTLTPLVLYIPSASLFLYVYNFSKPKTVLIPKNFEGYLRVVYEEKCGQDYQEVAGVKTLKFPKSGILILREDFDKHIDFNYYIVDDLGNKTQIPHMLTFKGKNYKRPCILVLGGGTIGQTIEANSPLENKTNIKFCDFYVYNKGTVDIRDFKIQQRFNSLTIARVSQCRQIQ